MKVFDKIKGSSFLYKEELKKVVCELIPLRGNESKTREYYDMYLHADYRYKIWKDERRDCIWNDCLDLNLQYNAFVHNNGEINKDYADILRAELLNVLEADKYSFAYIYNLLAQEANRANELVIYDCVFNSDAIDYAIKFDIDELQRKLNDCSDLKEKWKLCNNENLSSNKHPYYGELKDRFTIFCNDVIDSIKTEISIFGYSKPIPKSKGIPKELNTDNAKRILKELEGHDLIKNNDYGLQWQGTSSLFGYFADKVSDHLDIRPSNDKIPWKIFKTAFNLDDKCIETAKQAVNGYKNKGINEPEGYLIINKVLK